MIEIVQRKDEPARPSEWGVVSRTEEQTSIGGPQLTSEQDGVERMPRAPLSTKGRNSMKPGSYFISESPDSVVADPALIVQNFIHELTPDLLENLLRQAMRGHPENASRDQARQQ